MMKSKGRTTYFLLVSCCAIAAVQGCGGPKPQEHLIGKWQGKVELNEELVRKELEKSGDENGKIVFDALKNMKVDIEFHANGKMSMAATTKTPLGEQKETVSASWEIVEQDGNQVTIKSIREDDRSQHEQIEITLEGDDAFSTRPPGPNHQIGVLRMRKLR